MTDGPIAEAWQRVLAVPRPESLRALFAADDRRVASLTREVGDLRLDFSRQLVDDRVIDAVLELFAAVDVPGRIAALFGGEPVNRTENRSVGHVALRRPFGSTSIIGGTDVAGSVHDELSRLRAFTRAVHAGERRSAAHRPFTAIVNIGIGGSDLGPAMAYEALRHRRVAGIRCRFVANVDPADLASNLADLDPETTLFVVSSKTFTTVETMANAAAARRWLGSRVEAADLDRHFVAVTTNAAAAVDFGVSEVFGFWDWVGGRFSLGSAIGLSLMLGVGERAFDELLAGMHTMDEHVRTTAGRANVAVLMAAVGVWNRNMLGLPTKAVLPYAHDLRRFPAYLQQLDMESNGKSVALDGRPVGRATAPVIWGEPGTNAQHAFMQSLHQGTDVVPVDFIGFAESVDAIDDGRQETLFLNMLAQASALAFGRSLDEVRVDDHRAHRVFSGNRPSTTIVARRLEPAVLGQLVALYEHVVAIQGFVWGINSFDQFGVELGKELANELARPAEGRVDDRSGDPATHSMLRWLRRE